MPENFRFEFIASNVIEKEQGLCAEHGNVVDAVVHQIRAHGIVLMHRERDFQFRPHTVDTRDQNCFAHSAEMRCEQSAEATDLAEHLRPMRSPDI